MIADGVAVEDASGQIASPVPFYFPRPRHVITALFSLLAGEALLCEQTEAAILRVGHVFEAQEAEMRVVKRFEPISVMRIAAICYAVLGLFEGLMFSIFFAAIPFAGKTQEAAPRFLGPLFGVLSIFVFPFLFAAIGAIAGGLGAVIYNLSAKYVGGIEVEVA